MDDDDWTDGRDLTCDIVIPKVIGNKPPSTSLLSLIDYEQLQFKSFYQRLQRKTTKMTGKWQRKRASDWDATKTNPRKKHHNYPLCTTCLSGEITLCTAYLNEYERNYNDSLDPAAHLIHHLPPDDHNSDNIPVSIVPGVEEEDVD